MRKDNLPGCLCKVSISDDIISKWLNSPYPSLGKVVKIVSVQANEEQFFVFSGHLPQPWS
jgi:hypothetical protein